MVTWSGGQASTEEGHTKGHTKGLEKSRGEPLRARVAFGATRLVRKMRIETCGMDQDVFLSSLAKPLKWWTKDKG